MSESYTAGGKPTIGHCFCCAYARPLADGNFSCHYYPPKPIALVDGDGCFVAPKVSGDNCCSKWTHRARVSWLYDQGERAARARDSEAGRSDE